MKIVPHILGLAIACVAMPTLAKPAYIASTVNLRARRPVLAARLSRRFLAAA